MTMLLVARKLHRIHAVRTIAIANRECLSRGFTRLFRADMAERIEVLLGLDTLGVSQGTWY